METFELRYFLAVAEAESIRNASLRLRISPAALSKAIARIERETNVKLFSRLGRHIHLTKHGELLKKRATDILFSLDAAKRDLKLVSSELELKVVGPESLLAFAEMSYLEKLEAQYRDTRIEYTIHTELEAITAVREKKADIAFISGKRPPDLRGKKLGDASFSTFVGEGHPLFKRAKNEIIPIAEILAFPFVVPDMHQFGSGIRAEESSDGWRDDKFKRLVGSVAPSLFILMKAIRAGKMLAYIPDYLGQSEKLRKLNISGCPYSCTLSIFALFREDLSL